MLYNLYFVSYLILSNRLNSTIIYFIVQFICNLVVSITFKLFNIFPCPGLKVRNISKTNDISQLNCYGFLCIYLSEIDILTRSHFQSHSQSHYTQAQKYTQQARLFGIKFKIELQNVESQLTQVTPRRSIYHSLLYPR